jgi:hypothetical protein
MPILLTLPLRIEARRRVRQRRARRLAIGALLVLGLALLAAGFWMPAKAGSESNAETRTDTVQNPGVL